jgi:hypothetical protein
MLLKAESGVRLMPPADVAMTRLLPSSAKLLTGSMVGKRSGAGRPSTCSKKASQNSRHGVKPLRRTLAQHHFKAVDCAINGSTRATGSIGG